MHLKNPMHNAVVFLAGLALLVPPAAGPSRGENGHARREGGAAATMPLAPQILVGAGDIAGCTDLSGAEATAKLINGIPGTVFAAGDLAYESGTAAEFMRCYGTTWGHHKSRTRPTPGNHEYAATDAAPYFNYFGAAAGEQGKGYYSYELGAWHIVVINSNCKYIGGCGPGSPQEKWLRQDLAAHHSACTLAYWHHPLFSSGAIPSHARTTAMRPIWQALYEAHAEVIINGHEHFYERFAPQDPGGNADAPHGIREFVAGSGGRDHGIFGFTQPNSEVRNSNTFGVLKLTLRATGYDWQFIPVPGKTFTDSGSGTCH
jgi:hypothetical protein